jgi:hypothetical protein
MFTLPVDRTVAESEPIPGKISTARTWSLCLRVVPGVMVDFDTWLPGAQHARFESAQFDTRSVFRTSSPDVDTAGTRCCADRISAAGLGCTCNAQTLSICLTGFPQHEMQQDNRHAGVVLELSINNLPMLNVLENCGSYHVFDDDTVKSGGSLMGENGCQTLEILTPIHVWLLQNQQHICNYYTSPRLDGFK